MHYGAIFMIVYIYTFPNGKKYVGQTTQSIKERSKNGEGYIESPAVYAAIKKYGWDNIIVSTYPCKDKDEMNELEQFYIKVYKTYDNRYGYNLTLGGDGSLKYNRDKIYSLWESGMGVSEIARYIGCKNSNTISQILINDGKCTREEINERKRRTLSKTAGVKLQEYYSTEEHKQERIQNGLKGAKVRSKPVYVFKDKAQKEFIGYYESGRKAAKALNIDHSMPSYAITHNHYACGYWFYLEEDLTARDTDWYRIFGEK